MLKRLSIFAYGLVCYAVFFATFLYALGFVGNFGVPRSIDGEPRMYFSTALLIDLGLLGIFAIQHSLMARPYFKRWLTQFIPASAERSTYVLFSSLALIALFAWWEPIGGMVWDVADPAWRAVLYALFAFGWGLVLVSTFLINHFDLFGLRQIWLQLRGKAVYGPAIRHAGALQADTASAVSRLVLRVLGDADHVRDPPGVCAGDNRLHPHRHPARGARPHRRAGR